MCAANCCLISYEIDRTDFVSGQTELACRLSLSLNSLVTNPKGFAETLRVTLREFVQIFQHAIYYFLQIPQPKFCSNTTNLPVILSINYLIKCFRFGHYFNGLFLMWL